MIARPIQRPTLPLALILTLTAAACSVLPSGASAAPGREGGARYPAGASRPALTASRARLAARGEDAGPVVQIATSGHGRRSHKLLLRGDPARAWLSFEAMQQYYYLLGSGLYKGEPFSYLWPFSQALAATVSMANIPLLQPALQHELKARLVGLRAYYDADNAGSVEGTFTSSLAGFDGTVAPPAGPGGPKYYDDNDWIGIELMRLYKITRTPSLLSEAESIMAWSPR